MNELLKLVLKIVGIYIDKYEKREAVKSQFHAFYASFGAASATLHDDYESQKTELNTKK